jgi:hypothetical protein
MTLWPPCALTAAGRCGCSRRVSWPPSLSQPLGHFAPRYEITILDLRCVADNRSSAGGLFVWPLRRRSHDAHRNSAVLEGAYQCDRFGCLLAAAWTEGMEWQTGQLRNRWTEFIYSFQEFCFVLHLSGHRLRCGRLCRLVSFVEEAV